jgi:hypothetical protein
MKRHFVAVAILGLFSYGDAQARVIYVSPKGNDSSNGTLHQPVATPARAIAIASTGDRLILRSGNYQLKRSLYVNKAGLTITSAPNEKVLVSAPTDESSGVQNVVVITASQVTLANLEVRGGTYYGIKVDVDEAQNPTKGVVLRNLRVSNTGRDCIKTFKADNLLIEKCNIGPSGVRDSSNAEGIDSIASHKITVRDSFIHDTATNGIYFKGGTTDGLIERCRIINTKHAGILLGQDTDQEFMRDGTKYEAIRCTARNNIIANIKGAGMGTYSGDSINFENNTLYNVAREIGAGVWIGVNRRNIPARNIRVVNNIIVTGGNRPLWFILNAEGSLKANYNLYYSLVGKPIFRKESGGQTSNLNWEQWRRIFGTDSHSRVTNPSVDTANLYKPRMGSPAIGRGLKIQSLQSDFNGNPRKKSNNVSIGAHEVDGR